MYYPRGTQQEQGRNGTLIVNVGGQRQLKVVAVAPAGELCQGDTCTVQLEHSSVVVFGCALNAVATHEVLDGGKGERLSLVYEFALYPEKFVSIREDLEYFDEAFNDGVYKRQLLWRDIKSEVKKKYLK